MCCKNVECLKSILLIKKTIFCSAELSPSADARQRGIASPWPQCSFGSLAASLRVFVCFFCLCALLSSNFAISFAFSEWCIERLIVMESGSRDGSGELKCVHLSSAGLPCCACSQACLIVAKILWFGAGPIVLTTGWHGQRPDHPHMDVGSGMLHPGSGLLSARVRFYLEKLKTQFWPSGTTWTVHTYRLNFQ